MRKLLFLSSLLAAVFPDGRITVAPGLFSHLRNGRWLGSRTLSPQEPPAISRLWSKSSVKHSHSQKDRTRNRSDIEMRGGLLL
jgi:hypothetical protein